MVPSDRTPEIVPPHIDFVATERVATILIPTKLYPVERKSKHLKDSEPRLKAEMWHETSHDKRFHTEHLWAGVLRPKTCQYPDSVQMPF